MGWSLITIISDPQITPLEQKNNGAIITLMNMYGLSGFIIGFLLGMLANLYLLRGISREKYLKDKSLRMRFGLLNWGFALLGMAIGLAIQ